MPFPRSILDICIVFPQIDKSIPQQIKILIERWQERGWIDQAGKHKKEGLLKTGAFFSVMIEHAEIKRLYGNHQGGYRVICPVTRDNISQQFSISVSAWRNGGLFSLFCPYCNEEHRLDAVQTEPQIYFSFSAIILKNVDSITLHQDTVRDIEEIIGEFAIVYKRLG